MQNSFNTHATQIPTVSGSRFGIQKIIIFFRLHQIVDKCVTRRGHIAEIQYKLDKSSDNESQPKLDHIFRLPSRGIFI